MQNHAAQGWCEKKIIMNKKSKNRIETENGFVIRVEIAGMAENDFSVNYDRNMLIVQGKRSTLDLKCAYNRMEISYGDFSTYVSLPETADIRHAIAEYENGFLTIRIPRTKPMNVKISSDKEP